MTTEMKVQLASAFAEGKESLDEVCLLLEGLLSEEVKEAAKISAQQFAVRNLLRLEGTSWVTNAMFEPTREALRIIEASLGNDKRTVSLALTDNVFALAADTLDHLGVTDAETRTSALAYAAACAAKIFASHDLTGTVSGDSWKRNTYRDAYDAVGALVEGRSLE